MSGFLYDADSITGPIKYTHNVKLYIFESMSQIILPRDGFRISQWSAQTQWECQPNIWPKFS